MSPSRCAATFLLLLALTAGAAHAQTGTGQSVSGPFGPRDAAPVAGAIFVDASASGANTGTSWMDAFTDLQSALAIAGAGDEVWVATGTYRPGSPGAPPTATFAIPSGAAVYGGFAGGETSLADRDPTAHPTVLTGDVLGDDTYTPIFNVGTDNVWHVVRLDGTAAGTRLDGFRVRAGHFWGASGFEANGGGIFAWNAAGTIANCEVSWSVSNHGGGLYVYASDIVVEDCQLHDNWASTASFAGGAVALEAGGTLTVRDSSLTSNTADGVAGGVAGGAIAVASGTALTVERCTFAWNEAANRLPGLISIARGGAIYNQNGTVLVSESVFTSNTSNSGGAVFAWSGASTTLVNCLFDGNWVTKYVLSGGIEGGGDAGAVTGGTGLALVGCLVTGGTADNNGGVSAGAGLVSGCILWGNQDDKGAIGISQVKADEVRYSCVENMLVGEPGEDPPDPEKFPGCTDQDPLFADELAGDFHLSPGSPAIDAAENPAWPPGAALDLDGNPRFVDDPLTPDTGVGPGPIADMGPFEHGSALPATAAGPPPPIARLVHAPGGALRLRVRAGREHAGRAFVAAVFVTRWGGAPQLCASGVLDANGAATVRLDLPAEAADSLTGRAIRCAVAVGMPSAPRLVTSPAPRL